MTGLFGSGGGGLAPFPSVNYPATAFNGALALNGQGQPWASSDKGAVQALNVTPVDKRHFILVILAVVGGTYLLWHFNHGL